MAEPMNKLNGKEWLQSSFSIWRDEKKNAEEKKLKHPAMYPIALAEKLIKIYTKDDGEVILDPFSGVGSTIIAAKNLNKKGIGMELNPEFCEVSKQRLNQSTLTESKFEQKIICEDSRNLSKHIDNESVDLCINSPPYWDILNQKRTVDDRKIGNYSDSDIDI